MHIGVDPGKSGAIAFLPSHGSPWAIAADSTHHDLCQAMREAWNTETIELAVIEQVHSSPQMGVVSAFSFGQSYGSLEMLLAALNVPFERVRPLKWQTAMQCKTGGDKNVSKRRAQELFPSLRITHRNADALLLAKYAQKMERG